MQTVRPVHASPFSIRITALTLLLVHLCFGSILSAQAGEIDTGFGIGGATVVAFDRGDDFTDEHFGIVLQPDGKVVMVGRVDAGGSQTDFGAVRLSEDGFLDPSFGTSGLLTVPFDLGGTRQDDAFAVGVAQDGKVVLAGQVDTGSSFDIGVARVDASGSLDPSFGGNGRTTVGFDLGDPNFEGATSIAFQADGKILLCGAASTGRDFEMIVVRLNTNGTLDSTFDGDGKLSLDWGIGSSDCRRVMVQANGRIVLAGWAQSSTGRSFAVARLTSAGGFDRTFGSNGRVLGEFDTTSNDSAGIGATLDSAGRIVVVGSAVTLSDDDVGVARLLPSGVLDPTFSGDGRMTVSLSPESDFAVDVAMQADGAIVLAATVSQPFGPSPSSSDFAALRLRSDGSVDPSFGNSGWTTIGFDLGGTDDDEPMSVAVRPDGSGILVSGYAERAAAGDKDFIVVQLQGDPLFADGFESGDTSAWSATTP